MAPKVGVKAIDKTTESTLNYYDSSFFKVLFKWKGSLWQSLWKPLLVFMILYVGINLIYRFAFTESQQRVFEGIVIKLAGWIALIPLQFLLGFFVSYVVARWWDQLNTIPFPDKFLLCVASHIPGDDEETLMIRRSIARWLMLHCVLVWREISKKVKKRFPTDDHLLNAGLITDSEYQIYENTSSVHGRWWVPVSWVANCMRDCKKDGRITDYILQSLLNELYAFRAGNGMLTVYDWITIPLRYTQVTTLATYGYFALTLIGRQTLIHSKSGTDGDRMDVDVFIPWATILEFLFYFGWLKVADEYRMPFGDGKDDFDMNYLLDRNIHLASMLVDELAAQNPPPCKDKYWGDHNPKLPHTKASYLVRDRIPPWKLRKMKVKPKDAVLVSEDGTVDTDANPVLKVRKANGDEDESTELRQRMV